MMNKRPRGPLSFLLFMLLTTALISGCGGSRDQYVFTGTGVTITQVDVQPATATVQVGGTQQYTVEITLSNGDTLDFNQFNGQVAWDSDPDTVATIDQNGLATGLSPGTATITATVTTASQQTFTDTATLTVAPVVNTDPIVNLDDSSLNYARGSGAVALSPNATVTDDQANLDGGTLTIAVEGDNTGVDLAAPATPDIGTVTDDDATDTITVALDTDATPDQVQAFLRGVQFSADNTANFGATSVSATLTDGQAGSGSDTRTVNIQGASGQDVTVGPTGDFLTIQAAVNAVAAQADAQGSVIRVAAGSYVADGTANDGVIVIGNDPDLEGLQILGPNAGVSAGINPGTRGAEAIVNAFDVSNNVVIDGFQINGGPTSLDATTDQGVGLGIGSSGTIIRNNRIINLVADAVDTDNRGILLNVAGGITDLVIEFNRIEGFLGAAFLQGNGGGATGDHTVDGNVAVNNAFGFSTDFLRDTSFTNNVVRATDAAEEAFGFGSLGTGVVVNNNDLADQVINVYGAGTVNVVNAENNWWGQATGPVNDGGANDQINRDGDAPEATIDFDPFLTADPFPTLP